MAKHKYENDRLPVFTQRFKYLVKTKYKDSVNYFSEQSEICRQTITKWYNGDTVPDSYFLSKLCKFTGYSADWFIGLTEQGNRTSDIDIKTISEYTGLSNNAIKALQELKENPEIIEFINNSLETKMLIGLCSTYVSGLKDSNLIKVDESLKSIKADDFYKAYLAKQIIYILDAMSNVKEMENDGTNSIDGN